MARSCPQQFLSFPRTLCENINILLKNHFFMCRMLVALGEIPARILIDGMLPIAQDQTEIHEFNEQRGLESWVHKDGWGIAYLRGKHWVIKKSVVPFFKDKRSLQKMRSVETPALILHVRKASGSRVALRNTHPFLGKKKQERICILPQRHN